MIFLTLPDFKVQIRQLHLLQITDTDTTMLDIVELEAMQEMQSYLNQVFDCPNIFNKTGTARNALIVMYMVDMVIYHTICRISADDIPEIRVKRYEAAIAWLLKVSQGNLTPDLPKIPITDGSFIGHIAFGSNEKIKHDY